MLFKLKESALQRFEFLLDRAIEYDPAAAYELTFLQDQVVVLESTLPRFSLVLEITETGLKLHEKWSGESNVKIRGSLISMIGIALNENDSSSLSGTGVKISGDLDTLNQVNNIISKIDIDWEGALADLIGDVPSHLIFKSIRSSRIARAEIIRRAKSGLVEVAQEEFKLTPSTNEFELTGPKIRQLASDVDRLNVKVKRLQKKVNEYSQGTSSP